MRSHSIFVLAACLLCIAVGASAGTVVFSDNFAADTLGLGVTNLGSQWTVTAGNVDVIGTNSSWNFYPGNGQYLDLDGTGPASPSTNATIQTFESFGPGAYTLTFDLGNNPGGGSEINTLQILWGATQVGYLTTSGTMALTPETITFTATEAGKLSFAQGGAPTQQGSILANVQLASATPEPGTFAILGAGLIGLGLLRRRK